MEVKQATRRGMGAWQKNPVLLAGLIAAVLLVAGLDYMETIPGLSRITTSLPFQITHAIHDIIAIAVPIIVAYGFSPRLGVGLIVLFVAIHGPYYLAEFDHLEATRLVTLAVIGLVGIAIVAERRRAYDLFHQIGTASLFGIYVVQDGKFRYVNPQFQEITGYTEDDLQHKHPLELVHAEDAGRVRETALAMLKGEASQPYGFRGITKGKDTRWILERVASIQYRGKRATLGNFMDITDLKRAEERVVHLSNVLMAIRNVNQLITHEKDRERLIQTCCDLLIERRGYEKSWILLLDEDRNPVSVAGSGFSGEASVFLEQLKTGNYPECLKELMSQEKQFLAHDKPGGKHQDCVLAGAHSTLGVFRCRLEHEGRLYGVIGVSVQSAAVFDKEERGLFLELCGDIAFALANIEREERSKHAQETVRQSEERYRSLFDNMLEGFAHCQMLVKDNRPDDFVYLEVNDAFEKLTGLRDVVGRKVTEVIPGIKESNPELFEIYGRVAETGLPERFESYIGSLQIWLSISVYGPAKGYFVATFDNITKRKQAEEAIRASEERYRTLFESAAEGILIGDIETKKIILANPAICTMLGYSQEELSKMGVADIHPKASLEHVLAEFDAQAMGTKVISSSIPCLKKDGTVFYADVNAAKAIINKREHNVGFFTDVTQRNKMEEKLKGAAEEWRTTFDSVTDLISVVNKDCQLVRVNRAFAHAYGKKPEELIGRRCYQVVHGTNEFVPGCPIKETLRTRQPATIEYFDPKRQIHLEETASPIFDGAGEVVGSVNVARNITERKRMQEQLMLTGKLASIGELASGVAHELNNPLTSVIGFSQLLMERDLPDDVKEDLGLVHSEALRASGIIKNLLTFARKHPPVRQLCQIHNVIEDVLKLRAYEQKINNIEVVRRFAPELPEVTADYAQMQQVFLNIITNAEYFMTGTRGRGTLTVGTQRLDNTVRVSFADDGPGMAPENLSQVFNPFYTTKPVGKGTGLGLSISHGIVAEHGGSIYVTSQPGEGATFVVELPLTVTE